jgi:hypothetical protein
MTGQTQKKDLLFFLNRNNCIVSHIAERLEELKDLSCFTNLQPVLESTILSLELHLFQTENLYHALGAVVSYADCEPMIFFLEHIFTTIQNPHNANPFLSLLDYVYVINALLLESAELADLSLSHFTDLNLPAHSLYDIQLLQALKTALTEEVEHQG